jgi:hypothetical protein
MNSAKIHILLILACLFLQSVSGQLSVLKSEFQGREAYSLQNGSMRISMLSGGGYIAELRLLTPDGKESVNPMFIPHYQTIDPHDYRPEEHMDSYGSGSSARLLAGYMGHYLCFPYFGAMNSSFEQKLGYTTHGEAYTVAYEVEKKLKDDVAVVRASAVLPLTRYSINRSLTLMPGHPVVQVKEVIINLESIDRPYQWVQHITFGGPFLAYGNTFVDAPVSRIAFSEEKNDPLNQNTVEWPTVRTEGGDVLNVGVFGSDKGQGGYRAWFMDPERDYSWFVMYNRDLHLLVGYVFPKEENSWIGDWQENQHARGFPRNGLTVAWGLEVGTTPFGSGIKQSINRGPVFGTETYRWIGAKEKKEQSYLIFMQEINERFEGVKDLRLEQGAIVLTEKESATQIRISHGFSPPEAK